MDIVDGTNAWPIQSAMIEMMREWNHKGKVVKFENLYYTP